MARLNYSFKQGTPLGIEADTLAVLVPQSSGEPIIPDIIKESWKDVINRVIGEGDFKAEEGEVRITYLPKAYARLVLAGLGEKQSLESIRIACAKIIRVLEDLKAKDIVVYFDKSIDLDPGDVLAQCIEASEIALYDPGEVFKAKERREKTIKSLTIVYPEKISGAHEIIRRSTLLADAVNYARLIADTPSSQMNPEEIEKEARKLAETYGLGIKVFHVDDLRRMGMNGILAVGSGGGVPPRLIILEYKGREADEWDIGIVGKTVTFDAGGLDLKSAQSMERMKYDKSGGAVALGIIKAAASLKLPVNIVVALPAVENLPGPKAYKPRDIIRMYNGLTVEVGNTDAEGRIIMADALSYIEKTYRPSKIFDFATLTGAIVIALGNYAAGLFTNDDELAEKLYEIGRKIGEKLWRMPLWKEYYEQLKSTFADTNNIGGRPAGAITAAAFLSKFLEDPGKWTHLDIAGVAYVENGLPKKPYYRDCATGWGVRLLIYYIMEKHKER